MPINFRQLEVFCAVAEARSFTRASHVLFISQSTVSQHIRELEEGLGVTLFHRNRRKVSLTTAGEDLVERGHQIFRMIEEAETAVRTAKDPYAGKLSFGCASTTLLYHLPAILAEYVKRYPNVELKIAGGTIQEVAGQLWSGSLDFALVVLPLSAPALERMVLFEEGFVLVLPAKHPLAQRSKVHVSDVAEERFILHRPGQNTRKLVDKYLFKNRITPRVAVELAETEAIKAMVSRGLGISVLPESALREIRGIDALKSFPIPRNELKRSLAVVYPHPRALRPPAVAMIDLMKSELPLSGSQLRRALIGKTDHSSSRNSI